MRTITDIGCVITPELWSGYVKNVVDGDTIDVSFNIYGIQRVRLVGVNTPEIGEEAKEFVNKTCWGEAVKLDVDDREQYDSYYRILAVVYVLFRKNVTPTFSVNLRGVFPL
jgi:endonuclease YncB( thermonuclease family)